MKPPAPLSPAERLYRRLLRLLPVEFRGDFGDSMARDFSDRHRELAGAARRQLMWREVPALLRVALVQRVEDAWRDVQFSFRLMRRAPATTLTAIAMLALGTGANAAMFSVIDAVMLRAPFDHPERISLVRIAPAGSANFSAAIPIDLLPALQQARAGVDAWSTVGGAGPVWRDTPAPRRLSLECVSAGFFPLVGTHPMMGRGLDAEDDRPGAPSVLVASYEFWRRDLASDPSPMGRTLMLDGTAVTILGVMPRGFNGAYSRNKGDGWVASGAGALGCRLNRVTNVLVRARPGVERGALAAELTAAIGGPAPRSRIELTPVLENALADVRTPLFILLGAVGCVLLIACANVANLLVERAVGRRRELVMRLALGASRGRVLRQAMTEALVLCLAGGLAGILTAVLTLGFVVRVIPADVPHVQEIALNVRVLAATLGLALAAGLLVGVLPAWQALSPNVAVDLKDGAPGATQIGRQWTRRALVVGEIALSVVLLIGAVLMLRTFATLMPSRPGFDPSHKLVASIVLGDPAHRGAAARTAFIEDLVPRLSAVPGVAGVSVTTDVPMSGMVSLAGIQRADANATSRREVFSGAVSVNYFSEMAIPIVWGRGFGRRDDSGAPLVALVNETLARQLAPTGNVIGVRVITTFDGTPTSQIRTVVGVLGNTRSHGADTRSRAEVYWPLAQDPSAYASIDANVILRTTGPVPATIERDVRAALAAVDHDEIIDRFATLDSILDDAVEWPRFGLSLLGAFAVLAVGLATMGLASVVTWTVTQRTREIGVRIALGASASQVVGPLVRRGLGLGTMGVLVGLAASAALTRVMASWLYGVTPLDVPTFIDCALAMLALSAAASYLPARRATKIDPVVTLRAE